MTKFKLSFRSDRMERGREVVKQFGGDPDAVRRHATASAAVWVEVPDDRADELSAALDAGRIAGLACFRRMGAMPRVEFRAPRHVREWLGRQPVARIEWAMEELLRLEARVVELEKQVGPPIVRTLASIVPLEPMKPALFPRADGLDLLLPTAPGEDGPPGYRLSEDGAAIMSARSSGLSAFAMDANEGGSDGQD